MLARMARTVRCVGSDKPRRLAMRRAAALFVAGVACAVVGGACSAAHTFPSAPQRQPVATAAAPTRSEGTAPRPAEPLPPSRLAEEDAMADAAMGDQCPPPDEVAPENCLWQPSVTPI